MFLIRNPDNACIIDGRQDEDHVDNLSKARGKRLKKDFSDSLTEAHVSFYANALTLFTNYNQFCRDWIRLLTWWNPFSYSRCVGWCHRISFRKGLLFAVVLCLYWGEGWNPTTKPIWGRWYNCNRKKQGTWSSAGLLSRFKYVLKNVLQKMLVVERILIGFIFVTKEKLTGVWRDVFRQSIWKNTEIFGTRARPAIRRIYWFQGN